MVRREGQGKLQIYATRTHLDSNAIEGSEKRKNTWSHIFESMRRAGDSAHSAISVALLLY